MSYSAFAVANEFLKHANNDDIAVSPMKLQKLVYYAHGWYLAFFDKPLIDEEIQAWPYGPVIPSLYHEFKYYGNQNITDYAKDENGESPFISDRNSVNEDDLDFIKQAWDAYKDVSATRLSNSTHEKGTPWEQIAGKKSFLYNTPIPNEIIEAYFKDQLYND